MVVAMIVSIIVLTILFNFNPRVLTDELESIRIEEESHHKEVMGRYVKAAITGALSNLFPRVTNQEQTEAEKLLSEACPLYDPPLPQTLEQLDAKICTSYWSFKAGLINALPTQQLKDYYAESLKKYDDNVTKYLCLYHSDGSQACAHLVIPPPPTNVTRFTSSLMAMIESVAKITQIAL